jgi:hypothetical protein
VKKPKPLKKKTKKTKPAVQEESDSDSEDDSTDAPCKDRPFEAVAGLDDDMDVGLAANTEVPMEFEGEPLTAAELASVDMAEKEFAKKVRTPRLKQMPTSKMPLASSVPMPSVKVLPG